MPSPISLLRNPQDERLIPALLRGEIAQESNEGLRARRALVVLLLGNELTCEIRQALIELFDPLKRRVTIKKDWGKRAFKFMNEIKIAIHIYRFMQAHGPGTWNLAVALAAEQLGTSKGSARRAWGLHKFHVKRLHDAEPDRYQGWDLKLRAQKLVKD